MTVPPEPGPPTYGTVPPAPVSTGRPFALGQDRGADATAVMGRRFAAWVLDLLLFFGLLAGLYALQAEYVDIPADLADEACSLLEDTGGDDVASCAVIGDRAYVLSSSEVGVQTLVTIGYFVFFVVLQGATGGSPGKLLTGVRVVDEQGRRPGFGKSLGRTALWAVDGAPWIVPLVGPIVALTTTGHRRIGDMAAGTYVVARSSTGHPVVTSAVAPPAGQSAWGAAPADWPAAPPAPHDPSPGTRSPMPPPSPDFTERPEPPEPGLDIRSLDVPPPTERVDESTPEVRPDPAWWDDPSLTVDPPPATEDPGAAAPPEPPRWEPPAGPDVTDPIEEWQPPTSPSPDDEPPPDRAAPAEPAAEPADAGEQAGNRRDEAAGDQPSSPFVPPGGEPQARDPEVTDPWGTGSAGTAGTGGGGGSPAHYELPPPQWDQARNTYIQWDPNRAAWLQWDAPRQRWKPIDT